MIWYRCSYPIYFWYACKYRVPKYIALPKHYCIVLYLLPVLNPESYDGARVLEASGRPMLVIGRSYGSVSIQEGITKFADETTE